MKSHLLQALLILSLVISSKGCAAQPHNPYIFPAFDENFPAYRSAARKWLVEHSMTNRSNAAIDLNLPFEVKADPQTPYRGRFLLLHGLNDSPYVWQDFAQELSALGFDVRAILFEGHGSTPEQMLQVQWKSWLASARLHLNAMDDGQADLYVGGFSMGAVIATWLALDNPHIAGLFLVSPAYDSQLNPYLRWSGLYARFRPWVFGGMILEDNPIKYNSIPVNSGWQYFRLTRGLKRRWTFSDRIEIPTLMVTSENDSVVDVGYTGNLFSKRFTAARRLLLRYSASPASAADFEQIRNSHYPQLRVLNQSHLGLMYSPDNELFGKAGKILVCNGNEYPVFMACMRSKQHWFGAQHTPSPDDTAVARTTYNPDWEGVMSEFRRLFVE